MDFAKEKRAEIQSSMELMMQRWTKLNLRLKGSVDEPKSEENDAFSSKMRELREKENEILKKEREFELMKSETQKALEEEEKRMDEMSLDFDAQERALAKRESKLQSKLEEMKKRKTKLQLGQKKLANQEEAMNIKKMMVEMKMEAFGVGSSGSKPSQELVLKPAAKLERIQSASGSAKNEPQVQAEDGLHFSLPICQSHDRSYMTVPNSFASAFDLSAKKYVILSTDKGDFRLKVRCYTYKIMQFYDGWKDFYQQNGLSVGLVCIFKLKENTVDGEPSGFSMEVSVNRVYELNL